MSSFIFRFAVFLKTYPIFVVPVNKELSTGTVPVNKESLTGTVPVNNSVLIINNVKQN
jgi:hypothetical protein